MFKKSVIFISVLLISFGFVDIAFGNDARISNTQMESNIENEQRGLILYRDIYEAPANSEEITDYDHDGLTNIEEQKFGTDPYLADTDGDLVDDGIEIKYGIDPISWDTDGDKLADYMEIEFFTKGIGTSPMEDDSDHDGLPDPWEDNDGDTLLNIEEQHPKFKYGILGTNPNEVDSDGDSIRDEDEVQSNGPGPISLNSQTHAGYTQITTITPDRTNSALSVADKNSFLSKHLKSIGWTDKELDEWDRGLENAYKHGLLTQNNSCTVWYHYSPLLNNMPTNYDWDAGAPYRWNKYDSNPATNDTDGDIMDDNWDPRPLNPDDRLDSYVAIHSIRHKNVDYDAENPTNGNFTLGATNALKANFSDVEINKGDVITLTLWLGLEKSKWDSTKVSEKWWSPINVSIWFGTFLLGSDNISHGDISGDDFRGDDIWPDLNDTTLPSIGDRPWVTVAQSNYVDEYDFINSSGQPTKIHFYEQIMSIFLPSDLPAGIIGFIVRANPNTGENFYYESYTFPFVGY
jgi:hypothetical protein